MSICTLSRGLINHIRPTPYFKTQKKDINRAAVLKMPILKSKYPDRVIPDNQGCYEFVFSGVEDVKDKIAVIDNATGEELTYAALDGKVKRLANALYGKGIRKGDVVCLMADKSVLGIVAIFSVLKAGAILTPCRPSHTQGELSRQLNDSQAKALIVEKKLIQTAEAALQNSPSVKELISIGEVDGYECLDNIVPMNTEKSMPKIKFTNEDTAVIIYSSGTTGLPKGVIHTHYALIANTVCITRDEVLDDTNLMTGPAHYIGGLIAALIFLSQKKRLVLYTVTDVVDYFHKAREYGVRGVGGTPSMLVGLAKLPDEKIEQMGVDFSQFRFGVGGAGFSAASTKEFLSKTGAKCVCQVYGSTETAGLAVADEWDNPVPGSAGVPLPNAQIKISDLNTAEPLGPHQPGEICVKAPYVTKGYLNNPQATKEIFDSEGWLRMGDLGYYDESGHLFVIDRLKDVIKYLGMQVAPAEIEEVVFTHPAVKSVCVVPVPDESHGEVPLAFVILKEGHSASEEEIVKLVDENLADYKRLRGGVRFMTEFPFTISGKIMRAKLKELAKEKQEKQE